MNCFRKLRTICIILTAVLGSPVIHANETAQWLQGFYDSRGICVSSTRVGEITETDSVLTVHLEVENDYVQSLHRGGGDRLVQDWLALHCPMPLEAYDGVLEGKDIVVVADGNLELSCRGFSKKFY